MASAELFARLNIKNIRFDVGSGGIAELTPEMIAAACAGLPKGAWYLGLAKYAGQNEVLGDLEIAAWMLAADLAVKHKWAVVRGKPYLRAIAQLACAHVIDPHRCSKCSGTGLNRMHKACRRCAGTSIEPEDSLRNIAKSIGIPFESYRTTWEPRYRVLLAAVQDWDERLCRQLKRKLR